MVIWQDLYKKNRPLEKQADLNRLYRCGAAIGMFHVNPYGQLQPCLIVRHIVFDLVKGTIAEGLTLLRQRLAALEAPENFVCDSCSQRTICRNCPAFSYLETGIEQRPSDFHCQVTRARAQTLVQQ